MCIRDRDMIEVAMFADILTIKEAIEFNDRIKTEEDFFLTSCCCPVWFNMVKKSYPEIRNHMSLSVSPMIAAGRILKRLYQNAKVVFIAPCIAKKAEYKDCLLYTSCKALGHPLIGDSLYSATPTSLINRQALHSHFTSFIHPVSKDRIKIESKLAQDMINF